ncbi:MAG: hypothetical protein QM820_03200 [Minicystis sp.]
MFTDEIRITTRDHETREAYRVVLKNADEPGTDGLLIKAFQGDTATRFKVGTRVEFDIEEDKLPTSWSISGEHQEARQALRDFDFLVHDELPIQALKLRQAARNFAATCLATVRTHPPPSEAASDSEEFGSWGPFFDRPTGLLIRKMRADLLTDEFRLSYRGAPVRKPELRAHRLFLSCDAYFGQAKEVLQLSRETLTRLGRGELSTKIEGALERAIPKYLDSLRSTPVESRSEAHRDELAAASLEAYVRALTPASVSGNEWKDIIIRGDADMMRLGEIVNLDTITIEEMFSYKDTHRRRGHEHENRLTSRDPCKVSIPSTYNSWLMDALNVSHHASYDGTREYKFAKARIFTFHRKGNALPSEANSPRECLSRIFPSTWRRHTMPCSPGHILLAYVPAADLRQANNIFGAIWPRMICPFVIIEDKNVLLDCLPEYVRWTAKNADGGPKDETVVAKALWAFLQEADAVMSEAWKDRKAYDLAFAKRDLSQWLK